MQSHFKTTALLFLGASVLMLASWTGLMAVFDYPEILRQAPGTVLSRFLAGGDVLRLLWTGMTLAALLLLFAAPMLHRILSGPRTVFLATGTVFGVLSGLVQVIGLIRWVLVVPSIAQGWEGHPASREVWEALFVVVNQYGGVAVGETLGYLFTGVWLLFVGGAILRTTVFHRVAGWLTLAVGGGILSGLLESLGWSWAVAINAGAYLGLLGLLVYFGIRLLLPVPPDQGQNPRQSLQPPNQPRPVQHGKEGSESEVDFL